jgi:hypothetical protein
MADTVPAVGAAAAAAASASQPAPRQLRSSSLTPDGDDSKDQVADAPRAAFATAAAAAASAAAAVALRDLTAGAKGRPWSVLHSSEQVAVLGDDELWPTIAECWCKPGGELIKEIVDTWEGRDLAACVYRLGLPVLPVKKNYIINMKRSVVDAVRKYATEHPDLFEGDAAAPVTTDDEATPAVLAIGDAAVPTGDRRSWEKDPMFGSRE